MLKGNRRQLHGKYGTRLLRVQQNEAKWRWRWPDPLWISASIRLLVFVDTVFEKQFPICNLTGAS